MSSVCKLQSATGVPGCWPSGAGVDVQSLPFTVWVTTNFHAGHVCTRLMEAVELGAVQSVAQTVLLS